MRFYTGAHDYLWKLSNKKLIQNGPTSAGFSEHLYLVAEFDNEKDVNAVMLHNGNQKLGSVTAAEAPSIKRIFAKWRAKSQFDDVIVCNIDRIYTQQSEFGFAGSVKVHGKFRVTERLARKHADKFWRK